MRFQITSDRRLAVARLAICLLGVLGATAPVAAQEESKSTLPLGRVVLYSSGVGFFEHAGEIEGDAVVDLQFNIDDINDLLKSMVLQDFGGGKISTVTYGSQDPITKTLKTFAIDLTKEPTLADLLRQVRGEEVEIEAANDVKGIIVGVEERERAVGKDVVVEAEFLNLLTDAGLRSFPLESVTRIKFSSEKLDAEFRQALRVLALGHATDKKSVSLKFTGDGKRPVRVGYVQESPIWKTSYRLVLTDEQTPFLQGWAIVENTTEQDWKGVDLTLVSGRPISFVMDLYASLFVNRPVVEPELFASLRPQTYGQDLADAEEEFEEKAAKPAAPAGGGGMGGGMGGGGMGGMAGGGFGGSGRSRANHEAEREPLDLSQGAESLASAGEVGELFQYQIELPVDLPRQQSAMLSIVNASVEGKKVDIYNPSVHVKHPLSGLYLTNSTDLHLMQGPITVFDDGAYAGDAQIQDLPPGSKRLISYALDLDVEVAPASDAIPEQLLSVKVVKGLVEIKRKLTREQKYTIKNSGKRVKTLLIEQPLESSWKLVAPAEPAETTRDRYRFEVQAEPGKGASLAVREEQVTEQTQSLGTIDEDVLALHLRGKVATEQVKQAFRTIIERRQALSAVTVKQAEAEQKIDTIGSEQKRLRDNLAQVERNTPLYNRYIKKLTEEEDEIEKLRDEVEALQKQAATMRKELEEFVEGISVD